MYLCINQRRKSYPLLCAKPVFTYRTGIYVYIPVLTYRYLVYIPVFTYVPATMHLFKILPTCLRGVMTCQRRKYWKMQNPIHFEISILDFLSALHNIN